MPVTKTKASIDHVYKAFEGVCPVIPEGEGRAGLNVSKEGGYHVCHVAKLGGLLTYEMDTVKDMAGRMAIAAFDPKLFGEGADLPKFTPKVGMVVTVSIVELPDEE